MTQDLNVFIEEVLSGWPRVVARSEKAYLAMHDTSPRLHEVVSPASQAVLDAIASSPGVVLLLGGSDTGKTTWGRHAAMWLGRQGCFPLALVDADIGQASLGPPAAVALSVLHQAPDKDVTAERFRYDALSFVGSVSPMGHALQMVTATKRLVERAQRAGATTVLVDTTGLIAPGFGFQIKLRKTELVNPAHLVVFQHRSELEPLLSIIGGRTGVQIHRLPISESVKPRAAAERAAYRTRRFAAYFSGARTLPLPTATVRIVASPVRRFPPKANDADVLDPAVLRTNDVIGLLMGLNDADDETLGLAWLEGLSDDGCEIHVRTPVTDAAGVRIAQLGSLRLDEACRG